MLRRSAAVPAVLMLLSCGKVSPRDGNCACTTAIGASECGTDATCVSIAENTVNGLMSPQVSPYHVVDSACTEGGVIAEVTVRGPACHCQVQGGGMLLIGPTGLPCSLTSRGGGCLWDTTAWSACDPTVADSCAATCADAEARLAADAARVFDTEVRLARCGGVYCDIVIRVDDRCYVRGPNMSPAYDCALSDDQILAAERARLSGTSTGGTSGSGVTGGTTGASSGGASGAGGVDGAGGSSGAAGTSSSCRC